MTGFSHKTIPKQQFSINFGNGKKELALAGVESEPVKWSLLALGHMIIAFFVALAEKTTYLF